MKNDYLEKYIFFCFSGTVLQKGSAATKGLRTIALQLSSLDRVYALGKSEVSY
jgi:hypothetical protein